MELDAKAEPLRPRSPAGCCCGEHEGVAEGWGGRPCPAHPAPPRCDGEHAWGSVGDGDLCAIYCSTRGALMAEVDEYYDDPVCVMVHSRVMMR